MANYSYEPGNDGSCRRDSENNGRITGCGTDENQTCFDLGRGVIRTWRTIVGDAAQPNDDERLQELLEAIAGYDDEGEGNRKPSPVLLQSLRRDQRLIFLSHGRDRGAGAQGKIQGSHLQQLQVGTDRWAAGTAGCPLRLRSQPQREVPARLLEGYQGYL